MHPDKWPEIKEKILKNFTVLNQEIITDDQRQETREIVEFKGPSGTMKVEWITRAKIIDKKTQYSRRIGSAVSVDYIYSADEFTHALKDYLWNEASADWQEINAQTLT